MEEPKKKFSRGLFEISQKPEKLLTRLGRKIPKRSIRIVVFLQHRVKTTPCNGR